MHIIFESVLMLLSKLVCACRNYSLPKLARFMRYSAVPMISDVG